MASSNMLLRALCFVLILAAAVSQAPAAPTLMQIGMGSVVLPDMPGVLVNWQQANPPGTGIAAGYYVTARPVATQNSTMVSDWGGLFVQDTVGSCGANLASASARFGWVRLTVTSACYTHSNARNTAPLIYYNVPQVSGSWSWEVRVDMWTPNGNAAKVNLQAGVGIFERNGWTPGSSGSAMQTLVFWMNSNTGDTFCYFQNTVTNRCPAKLATAQFGRAYLAIDYDFIKAEFAFKYRYCVGTSAACAYTVINTVTELVLGFKYVRPTPYMVTRALANIGTAYVDFTSASFLTTGPAAKPFRLYLNGPQTSVSVYLPRYTMFNIGVRAISASGLMSSESQLNAIVVVGAASPTINVNGGVNNQLPGNPANSRLSIAVDMSSETPTRSLASTVDRSSTGWYLYQPTVANRPFLLPNTLFDKSSMYCGAGKWFRSAHTTASYFTPVYVSNNQYLSGMTYFLVIRSDINSAQVAVMDRMMYYYRVGQVGYSFLVGANNANSGFRSYITTATTNIAATTSNARVAPEVTYIVTLKIENIRVGVAAYNIYGRLNGENTTWTNGGFGAALNDNQLTGTFYAGLSYPLYFCSEYGSTTQWSGHIHEILMYRSQLTPSETVDVENYLMAKYYTICPPLNQTYIDDKSLATVAAGYTTPCNNAKSGATCRLQCPASTQVVAGYANAGNSLSDMYCRDGAWSGGRPACGRKCPALSKPSTVPFCSKFLQWEHFFYQLPSTDVTNFWGNKLYARQFQAGLLRYSVFPAVPEKVFFDMFNILTPNQISVTLGTPAFSNLYDGENYNPTDVWRARQGGLGNNATTPNGTASSMLHASSLQYQGISPINGFVLFTPNPNWLRDGLTSLTAPMSYSTRVRPLAGRSGLAYRVATSSSTADFVSTAATSYYLVEIDADAMDPDVARNSPAWGAVMTLYKYQAGTNRILSSKTWAQFASLGFQFARGRWYTISATVTTLQQTIYVTDDATGSVVLAFVDSDVMLPSGTAGMWIDGQAQFDDVRLNTTCPASGVCDGVYSNMHYGAPGMCYYECPARYEFTGDNFRTCNDTGGWTGAPLVCSPPPPTFNKWVARTAEDMAMMIDGVPTFFRTVKEHSPRNTVVGTQLGASAPAAYPELPVLFQMAPEDPNNMDVYGNTVFNIDACGGTVKVSTAALNYNQKKQWNVTVWAYVTGEFNTLGIAVGKIVINIEDVNDPPVLNDATIFIAEDKVAGFLIGPNPLVAYDPDVGQAPPVLQILAGNDAGLFVLGKNSPLVSQNVSAGQLSLAPGVNIGKYASTAFCTCKPKVLNFEENARYTLIVRAVDSIDSSLFAQAFVTIIVVNENDQPYIAPNQLRAIDELTAATYGASLGNSIVAVDEDVASGDDMITFSIDAIYGRKGSDGTDAQMPLVQDTPPFALNPEDQTELIVLNELMYSQTDPAIVVQGYMSRAVYRVAVRVTDSYNATSVSNVTIIITANVTAAVNSPIINEFVAPEDGLSTEGTDVITVRGDYFPVAPDQFIRATYTMPARSGSPAVTLNSNCYINVPASGVSETGMSMNCTTSPGVGTDYVWTFRRFVGTANATVPMGGSVRPVTSYTAPRVETIVGYSDTVDPGALATSGNQRLNIVGTNFGPSTQKFTDVPITMSTTSPFNAQTKISYSLSIVSISHRLIVVTTPPGVGPSLSFALTIGRQTIATTAMAAYAAPVITSVAGAVGSGVNISALSGAGGESILITGANFGPLTLPSGAETVSYTPTVSYGPNGNYFTMSQCTRTSGTENTRMVCLTDSGIGFGHSIRIRVGATSQSSALSTTTLSYADPVVTNLHGGVEMATLGNERLTLIGTNLGTPALALADAMTILVTYGPLPSCDKFVASGCTVMRPAPNAAAQITCSTVPGTGTDFGLSLAIKLNEGGGFRYANQYTSRPGYAPLGYAPPIISSFGGVASNADTTGGQTVAIYGINFGQELSSLEVYYSLTLRDAAGLLPIVNGTQSKTLQYRPINCTYLSPHTALACTLSAGVGTGLQWTIYADGQISRNPSTSYAPPVINTVTLLQKYTHKPITGADTNGGDVLLVAGSGYGPNNATGYGGVPLIQTVSLISPIGLEAAVPRSSWRHVNDGLINITLPGGSGAGWTVRLTIADRSIDSDTKTFDYASPIITSMSPQYGPSVGGTVVAVEGINFGLGDPLNEIGVLFGNTIDQSLHSIAIRASRVPIPGSDGSYYPNKLTFKTPAGFGAGRAVRLVSYRVGTAMPIPRQYNMQPLAPACNASLAGGGEMNASTCTGIDMFSYIDPAISVVVITRPIAAEEVAYATARFGSTLLQFVRVLNIYGANLGSGTNGAPTISRSIDEWMPDFNAPGGGTWLGGSPNFYYDLAGWNENKIVAYTLLTSGTIRVSLKTFDWSGQPVFQRSPASTFLDYSPVAKLTDESGTLQTIGGVKLNFTVQFLASAAWFNVTVGGSLCTLIDPTDPARKRTITDRNDIQTRIVLNMNIVDPVPLSAESLWSVQCYAPPGQGSIVPLIVTRYPPLPEGLSSKLDGTEVSYAPPSITGFAISDADNAATAYIMPYDPNIRLRANTDGSSVLILAGKNFGVCPHVAIATHILCFCSKSCPLGGFVITNPLSTKYDPVAYLAPGHNLLRVSVPPGEGDGLIVTGDGVGWTITLNAGDQFQDTGIIRFGYLPPVITSIVGDASLGFPTRGNVTITVHGVNFGSALPNFVVPATLAQQVLPSVQFFQPKISPIRYLPCARVRRLSHTVMTCSIPEGAGFNLSAIVSVFGLSNRTDDLLAYNPPVIDNVTMTFVDNSTGHGVLVTKSAKATGASTEVSVPTRGGFLVTMGGRNFGSSSSEARCVYIAWRYRPTRDVVCDGAITVVGEGELPAASIISWSHSQVVFKMPAGAGYPELLLSVASQRSRNGLGTPDDPSGGTGAPAIRYMPPLIRGRLSPDHTPTDTAMPVELSGYNLGFTPSAASGAANTSFPLVLGAETVVPPTYGMRINWGPQPFTNAAKYPTWAKPLRTGPCICSSRDANGNRMLGCSECQDTVLEHDHDRILFMTHPGVGRNVTISVTIIDGIDVYESTVKIMFDYDPPKITRFAPLPVVVGTFPTTLLRVTGDNFGTAEIMMTFLPEYDPLDTSNVYNQAGLAIDGDSTWCRTPMRTKVFGDEVVECELQGLMVPVGYHNATIFIAGQTGDMSWTDPAALRVVCAKNYWGRSGETCLQCPMIGASCDGYLEISPRVRVTEKTPGWASIEQVYDLTSSSYVAFVSGYHTYPRPTPGFYSLNGTEASACPDAIRAQYPGRDVCIVKCEPEDSCAGDNYCGNGYVSKAPMFRCASCAPRFFRRNGECIPCPSSPWAVFVGFGMIVIGAGCLGYFLNKKNVNIAVLSIGIDFFQVLAIFGAARIKWPDSIKQLFYILSAFNLNIEIVAPECLVPDVSFKQKFYAIFLLPLSVFAMFFVLSIVLSCCKALTLRRCRDKEVWTSHVSPLVAASLTLFYFMYIYLTRTLLDIFNCTPTTPPDGKLYLQVVFEECGVPGGTQLSLLPWAAAGFLLYTAGYPVSLGLWFYRNRVLIMEDQLLRALGIGDDKLTNPRALEFRRKFHKSYYQFKPDFAYFWVIFIIIRKFCIAATSILFNKNAAFQMAACLLVMFLAYTLQVKYAPYMSPADGPAVIKQHDADMFVNAVHRQLEEHIKEVKARGRKRTRRNLLTYDGRLNRGALLGILGNWLFNYNTIEGIMLFAGVIVSLMGIMYVAQDVEAGYQRDPKARDSITAVVMMTIAATVIYFAFVVITEIVILYNQAGADAKTINAARPSKTASKKQMQPEAIVGPVDQQMNPLFLKAKRVEENSPDTNAAIDAIMSTQYPPPPQLWALFQDTYGAMSTQLQQMSLQLADAKQRLGRAQAEGGGEVEMSKIKRPHSKAAFGPTRTGEDGDEQLRSVQSRKALIAATGSRIRLPKVASAKSMPAVPPPSGPPRAAPPPPPDDSVDPAPPAAMSMNPLARRPPTSPPPPYVGRPPVLLPPSSEPLGGVRPDLLRSPPGMVPPPSPPPESPRHDE